MCGICGDLRFTHAAPVAPERVVAMRETLEHRGPDEAGLFVSPDRRVGLGFRRLRIIDLTPNASQPIANEDGTIQLVFNGEIYNYKELRRGLESRHQFHSSSDTETIVHLYEDKGVEAVTELEGMFALAIWDARKRLLVLARDRAGKKPLFFMQTPNKFVFASEAKAFFVDPELKIEPDPARFPAYFQHGYVPCPDTIYKDIKQVEPGHWLTIDEQGRSQSQAYWELRYPTRDQLQRGHPQSAGEVRSRVRELVERAVSSRLRSDVPLGAFLSGGIDSSIVVGIMSRQLSSPVRTFSIGFEGNAAYDETSYARMAAEHFGTEHTEFHVSPSAIDLVDKLVWHHDGPFGDSSAVPTYLVSQLTRQHVTVALNGDGGDELFAGYTRFAAVGLAERLPRWSRRLMAATLSGLPSPTNDRSLLARAQRFAKAAALPVNERMTRWISLFYDNLEALFEPACWASVGPVDQLAYLRRELPAMEPLSTLGGLLYSNYRTYLLNDLLVKMDRCSMANSLECRSPLLDRELTEYAASLPDSFKLQGWRTKVVLREAFKDLLPPKITGRGKMGFGVPLDAWFRGDLRDYVRDILLAPNVRYAPYLSRPRVESLVEAHQAGKANLGLQLWTLLTFEVWLRNLAAWTRKGANAMATATQ
jgi:asparagine synthase (glutamine-hydrolysing)